jgi:hypothetical protein
MSIADEIAALQATLEKLITGGQPVEVEENGRSVRYQPGDADKIRELIQQKQAAGRGIARTPARRVLF